MPPKRGRKRKQDCSNQADEDGDESFQTPIDRETWSGWVEMESEPAFFNVMLKDMGVRGVKIQEVYSLDDSMLAVLPKPVYALIFLFRYREADWTDAASSSCPSQVWFANQTPDFACATFAMLNIINNIPDLHLGPELASFKAQTRDMHPLARGDAIDNFAFVKKIHNSFASETDLMQADMFLREKSTKLKRVNAAAKANETKAARKVENMMKLESLEADENNDRKSTRTKRATLKRLSQDLAFNGHDSPQNPPTSPRRSARTPKPRRPKLDYSEDSDLAIDEQGFHFVAYMPIAGHVWKLDGLDRFPEDMGEYEEVQNDWMAKVQPALISRMARYEGAEIEFNLMAVVHDTVETDRADLMENLRALQGLDAKIQLTQGNFELARKISFANDLLSVELVDLGLAAGDFDVTTRSAESSSRIDEAGEDLAALFQLREQLIERQTVLKAMIRDSLEMEKSNEEKARHRRHDYGSFVRQWLHALVDQGILDELLNTES